MFWCKSYNNVILNFSCKHCSTCKRFFNVISMSKVTVLKRLIQKFEKRLYAIGDGYTN